MRKPAPVAASVILDALLLACTLAAIWGGLGFHLWQNYQRTLRDAENQTINAAWALEETVGRSLAAVDQSLEHIRELYTRDPEHFTLDGWSPDKSALGEIGPRLSVANASGLVVTNTFANAPRNANIADQAWFQAQVAAPDDRLFIGNTAIGRAPGESSLRFSRRMTGPDGRFAGVVVASLDPDAPGVFRGSSRMQQRSAMLIGRDGIIRAAMPATARIGATVLPAASEALTRMLGDGRLVDDTETSDDPEEIVSYRGVTGYPLFVAVGISRQTAFASWKQGRRDVILVGLCLSLIALLVGAVTIRQRHGQSRYHRALTLTLENISQGVLMVDKRRRMPVVNRRVAALLGLPAEIASPGADFDALLRWQEQHGEFRSDPTADRRVAAMLGEGGIDPNLTLYERTRADGTRLEVGTTILSDGSAVRTFTDVTERNRIEQEMTKARDAAQEGVRARTEFLAVMSHEIRTPMNGIVGAVGLLRGMGLTPEQLEYVHIIRESGDHLSSLIQNVLDFSRLDSGGLELEETAFDPRGVIDGIISMMSGQARAKGLALTTTTGTDVPAMVSGDPSRLRQILINLIGNGIKFTEKGGVAVDARLTASDANGVTLGIAVTDTGIGIDPANQQKLFSAFTQVDSSISRRFGGTGLGLTISSRLVALMQGTIDVESVPGRGSSFRFRIRLRRVAEQQQVKPVEQIAPQAGRRLRILLAEDNPTNRHVAIRMLSRMGHAVDAVDDGAKAVNAAAATDYDVILMDMMMPDVDGLAATRTIRAGTPPRCNVVIIGLTANALPADRAACEAAGMNDFVTKPVTMDRLRATLEQAPIPERGRADPLDDPASPMLDEAFLCELADGIGADGVAEMVQVFLEDAPGRVAAIRRAMADGAVKTIRFEAHALTGAARNVGLTRLGNAADMLRKASDRGTPDDSRVEKVAAALHESLPLAIAWAEMHLRLATSGV